MRTRALIVTAFLSLPIALSAQGVRPPRTGPRTPTTPQPTLPPEIGPVAQDLAYRYSRWSGEAYSLVSAVQAPGPDGSSGSYAAFGAGTHGEFRTTNRFAATVDITA